ncbi:hypothetical protein SCP_1501290 [Sparassis crispa]|uniref:MYND-type domain-containing protein n=1 Tax=Sparassis crispa TaxID=139825 RepID=A0A401H3V5_9APHY|nr:hypothetical protein SCP_1501290 [Sparassis crispa]GBE89126.1 hypothetical protein SCP_1501290 [Sparassis crispa]
MGKKTQKNKPKAHSSRADRRPLKSTGADGADNAILEGIDNAQTWSITADFICEYFQLPDLTTRSGLKEIHAKFGTIQTKLDHAFLANKDNVKVTGGIVSVWAKMSADAILRTKLFKAGFLTRLKPLLDDSYTRHLALQALCNVTHHGGSEARREIAQLTPRLSELMREHSDDAKLLELATVTIAHAVGAVISVEESPTAKEFRELKIHNVLQDTIENIRKPIASNYMIDHALGLLSGATQHCYKDCKAIPSLMTFLVACLRSDDLTIRCNAIGALIRLNDAGSEPDIRYYDPQKMIAAVSRRFPQNLGDIMMQYGLDKCDTTIILRTTADFQKAMMKCAQDRDLYALGKTLSQLIVRTEFSVAEGMFQAFNERTGQYEAMDIGLPFEMWTDALPICANALREKGSPSDLDMADIVDLKYLIIKQRIPDVVMLGNKAIERNPNLAYAYYAIGLGGDSKHSLRSVKKGLKCKNITPFVRNYMLWRAVDHAGNLAVSFLMEAKAGGKDYSEGVAFLMSALEDAKTFIAEAPPDSRNMQIILNWYIILTIALQGPEISTNLAELDLARKKLETADQFGKFLGNPPKRTQMRLTQEMIFDLYPKAVEEWKDVIARFDTGGSEDKSISAEKAEDDLAAWLDDLKVDDDSPQPERCSHPKINTNSVALYRCSWCSNPSAVLRKCGGCSKTRYCDQGCQKSHWSEHKRVCKAPA